MAPIRIARPRYLAYYMFEGGLILAVLYGLALLTSLLEPHFPTRESWGVVIPAGLLFTTILLLVQLVNPSDHARVSREIVIFSIFSVLAGLIAAAGTWILLEGSSRRHSLLLVEASVAVPLVIGAWRWFSVRFDVMNVIRERILIVGSGEVARDLCRWIRAHHGNQFGIVGFASETERQLGTVLAGGIRVQTHFGALAEFAPGRAERVIVALDEKRGRLAVRQLMELRLRGIDIEEATTFIERISGRIAVETMLPSWLIFSEGFKTSPFRLFMKRTNDLIHAVALLVLTLPIMLLTAILIKLDSRGPVFYRQNRLGRNGQEFSVLKFRSMREDAERGSGPTWATKNDPRVTRVGRVIRLLRIDELPQLINVLRGEMSFVGPRPERAFFVRQLEKQIPYYGLRLVARPGVTGWAQVQYRYASTEEDSLEKLKYDLYYIKNSSLLFDLWIVLKTIKVVLAGSGAR